MVPLAWALRTAGHDVRVASQPELTAAITNAGLTAVPVGRDHRLRRFLAGIGRMSADDPMPLPFATPPEQLTKEELTHGYREFVQLWCRLVNEPMIADLVDFCRSWRPDLVIWEPVTYAGPIAAAACGAVHARMMWSVDLFTRTRAHFVQICDEDPLAEWLEKKAGHFDEELTTGRFTVDNVTPSLRKDFDLHHRYLAMRYVPYNGVSIVPPWLREPPERPRVALTLGTSGISAPVPAWELLDALADLDIELVATLPDERPVPANTRRVDFVPLDALAPTCAAVVHHGGNGSYCTTLLHGVPQLVLPSFFDLPIRARYLEEQGAGLSLPQSQVSAEGVRERLLRLLGEPAYKENALRLREEMLSLPTPNDLVPELVGA
ncbi:activator-dependent family glycosyltransferase [Nonomuraea sp. 10N515B]|uniref:activator-dependent family glycosyltransferase n=1 Tax=Nonomuraea sp. 10N515B TaxID=3457422 RepID=UPI003FCC9075